MITGTLTWQWKDCGLPSWCVSQRGCDPVDSCPGCDAFSGPSWQRSDCDRSSAAPVKSRFKHTLIPEVTSKCCFHDVKPIVPAVPDWIHPPPAYRSHWCHWETSERRTRLLPLTYEKYQLFSLPRMLLISEQWMWRSSSRAYLAFTSSLSYILFLILSSPPISCLKDLLKCRVL